MRVFCLSNNWKDLQKFFAPLLDKSFKNTHLDSRTGYITKPQKLQQTECTQVHTHTQNPKN